MPPSKPRSIPQLPVSEVTSGYDELNLGRLALISGQKTVPANLQRWQKQALTPDGRPVIVTCTVPADQVVPHGLDNDFMVGLLNLCFEAGLPDGPFSVSAYALLKTSGLPDTAQYYQSLQESLIRLNKASYTIDEGWYASGAQAWTTQSFAQLSYLSYARSKAGIRGTNVITVQLAPPIMESLRAGYIKPLDVEFYRSLSQPLVRAVYRQLDALHFDERTANGLVAEISAPLLAWSTRLGLTSDRPDNLLRTLEPAHKELLARGYIAEVVITGRGRSKDVRYVFGPPPVSQHPHLAALLGERGVKQGVAVRLSMVFPERIEEAARRFDQYVKVSVRPIGNRGGLMVAMVQRPEDFADLPAGAGATKPTPAARATSNRRDQQDLEIRDAQEEARIAALEGQALVDWTLRQLTLLGVLKRLPLHQRAVLGEALQGGTLDARHLVQQATHALTGGSLALEVLVEDLQTALNGSRSFRGKAPQPLPVVSEGKQK
ncbi:replication initiator protein A [Deinococcus marmoris]|uniref:replication initiator protein A n=1 Tax=Deinococcus marmoris TaxID=249408 RepID=UPI0009F814F2|nr:replication initiator protein A [Deinococcus marmoris]